MEAYIDKHCIIILSLILFVSTCNAISISQDIVGNGSIDSRVISDSTGSLMRGVGNFTIGHSTDSAFSGFKLNGTRGTFRSWGLLSNSTEYSFSIFNASSIFVTSIMDSSGSEIDADFTGNIEEDIVNLSSGCKGIRPVSIGETDGSGTFHIISKVGA